MFRKRETCPDCGRELGNSSKQKGQTKMCLGNCKEHMPSDPSPRFGPPYDKLKKQIEAYKKLCMMADVPSFFIDNPEMIFSEPLDKKTICWAKDVIRKHRESKDFIDPSIH